MGRGPAKQRITLADAEFILAMAANGLRTYRAARTIPLSDNAAVHHVNKIKRETGLDPRDFYDMVELLPIAEKIYERDE